MELRAPNQFAFLNLTNEKYETPSPHPTSRQQHLLEIGQTWVPGGVLQKEWDMGSNYHRRVKFSAFPQASSRPPTLPLPRVPSGSLLLHSGCLPRSSEAIPGLPERRTALAGTWEPRGAQRGLQKRKLQPGRGCQGGEGATGGKAPGEGPAHRGRGLSHRVLGFPAPPGAGCGP